MRIQKLKLENHFILGDLELDFTDENGNTLETIIFAGENGTGKTVILELLYDLLKFVVPGNSQNERKEKTTLNIELSSSELTRLITGNYKEQFDNGIKNGYFTVVYKLRFDGPSVSSIIYYYDQSNNERTIQAFVLQDLFFNNNPSIVFSTAEVNYLSREINSVTAKDLDEKKNNQNHRSGSGLANEITQLLVDIDTIDSHEFAQWAKKNTGAVIDETKLNLRIKRFTMAFDQIFPKKKFHGVQNIDNHKVVMFEENGKRMPINKLSSGEKQIVFRGGFLLKDKGANEGAIVLIDEPEISLHPKWQLEILDFYKTIINSETENPSQIIVTTHSPFIIHNPNRRNDKVIILTKNEEGIISTLADPEFYSWTTNKIVKEAFNVDYNFSAHSNKVFVEGETDEKYMNKAIEIFGLKNELNCDISWIGRINETGGTEFTGDTALNHAKSFFLANKDLLHSKVTLCYDSDTNKSPEDLGNLLIRKMPKNDSNTVYKIGIENLLTLPEGFDYSPFYTESTKTDSYGAQSTIRTLDKTKLCNYLCDEVPKEQQTVIFENLRNLLEELK